MTNTSDIAIIGLTGEFPGANNLKQYWENLVGQIESLKILSLEECIANGAHASEVEHPNYKPYAGSLTDIAYFDANFFGLSPRDAELMDPQQRKLLEHAWLALEDANIDVKNFQGSIGVFLGTSLNTYLLNNILSQPDVHQSPELQQILFNNGNDYAATRIAYLLNLKGPAINVQTACSTSLVAIHEARKSLLMGECDVVIAGGASISALQGKGYVYQTDGILSADGQCKPFCKDASGTVFSSGLGLVVLKRLDDAIADQDAIYAVLKSTAVNNDGYDKVGYTAPSTAGQSEVIQLAQGIADIHANQIRYIEAHGTGTQIGDPIELNALQAAFADVDQKNFCGIGSVKSNIGHTDVAAGMAGFIKVSLGLQAGLIPTQLHHALPTQKFNWANSPFYILQKPLLWDASEDIYAGVSSFGIGGTNAHAILQHFISDVSEPIAGPALFIFSAKTEKSLRMYLQQFAEFIRQHYLELDLHAVAKTLQVGRAKLNVRCAIVAENFGELLQGMDDVTTQVCSGGNDVRDLNSVTAYDKAMLLEIASAWLSGERFDWKQFYAGFQLEKVNLPGYAFEKKKYWTEPFVTSPSSSHLESRSSLSSSLMPLDTSLSSSRNSSLPSSRGSSLPSSRGFSLPSSRGLSAGSSSGFLDPADKPRDDGKEKSQDDDKEKPRDDGKEKSQDDDKEKPRDDGKEKSQDDGKEEPRDDGKDKPRDDGRNSEDVAGTFGNIVENYSFKKNIDDWFYLPTWKPSFETFTNTSTVKCLLIVGELETAMLDYFKLSKVHYIQVKPSNLFKPNNPSHWQTLFENLKQQNTIPSHVLHTLTLQPIHTTNETIFNAAQNPGLLSLIYLTQSWHQVMHALPLAITVLTSNLNALSSSEICQPHNAPLLAAIKVIPKEFTHIQTQILDVDWFHQNQYLEKASEKLLLELTKRMYLEEEITYRKNIRYVRNYAPIKVPTLSEDHFAKKPHVIVITGGLGQLGLDIADYFSQLPRIKIVLLTRRSLPNNLLWRTSADDHPQYKLFKRLTQLEDAGASVSVYSVDVSDKNSLHATLSQIELQQGAITGVIHAAGETINGIIELKTEQSLQESYAAKVYGSYHLYEFFKDKTFDFFIMCSSMNAIIGGLGQLDNTAANIFIDYLAEYAVQATGKNIFALNWGAVNVDRPMSVNVLHQFSDLSTEHKKNRMNDEEVNEVYKRLLNYQLGARVVISTIDMEEVLQSWNRVASIQELAKEREIVLKIRDDHTPHNETLTAMQTWMTTQWQNLLGINIIYPNDNFFEIGGHSLASVQLITKIQETFKINIHVMNMYEFPVLKDFCEYLESLLPATKTAGVVIEKN